MEEKKSFEIKYTQEQIQTIIDILNSLPIQGVVNMQKILTIVQVLNEPFKNKKE